MIPELAHYLQSVRSQLRLDTGDERQILSELYLHLEEQVEQLTAQGLPRQEAIQEALRRFGRSDLVGRELYQVHHQGSWWEALSAAGPHLILAFLFWTALSPPFLAISGFLAFSVLVTLWGWWKGKPSWFYPWVGYCLVPPLVTGIIAASLLIQGGLAWVHVQPLPLAPAPEAVYLGLLVALGLMLWLFLNVLIRVLRRDWAFVSLMVMPFPVLVWWFLSAQDSSQGYFPLTATFPVREGGIIPALLAMAAASACFIRFHQRQAKILTLLIASSLVSLLLWASYSGMNVLAAAFLSLLSVLFLLSPLLLERRVKKEESPLVEWEEAFPGGAEKSL